MSGCTTPGCARPAAWLVEGEDFDGTSFTEMSCESCYGYLAESAYLLDKPLEATKLPAPVQADAGTRSVETGGEAPLDQGEGEQRDGV